MDLKKRMQEWEQKFIEMMVRDTKSKKEGTYIGRYISEPVADGKAYYVITKIKGSNIHVEHVDIYDGWTLAFVEAMDRKLPKKYVYNNIQSRDNHKRLDFLCNF